MYPIYEGMYERRAKQRRSSWTDARTRSWQWTGRRISAVRSTTWRRAPTSTGRESVTSASAPGSAYGVILATLEGRLNTIVFLDGGYFQQEHPVAGMDQADFAPRLKKPVLMVNGRYDATFPYESAQLPMFRMLGTPAADKRQVVFDTPHDVRLRRSDLVREVLAWYDKYLGRVN